MRKKLSDPRARERAAQSADAKQAQEAKVREQSERSEKDAVARAVLEALSAHDSM